MDVLLDPAQRNKFSAEARELVNEFADGQHISIHVNDHVELAIDSAADEEAMIEERALGPRRRLTYKQPSSAVRKSQQAFLQPQSGGDRPPPVVPPEPSAPPLSPDKSSGSSGLEGSSPSFGGMSPITDVGEEASPTRPPVTSAVEEERQQTTARISCPSPTGGSTIFDLRRLRRESDGRLKLISTPFGQCVLVADAPLTHRLPSDQHTELAFSAFSRARQPLSYEDECANEIPQQLALVTRVVSPRSQEARNSPGAQAAIQREYQNVVVNKEA